MKYIIKIFFATILTATILTSCNGKSGIKLEIDKSNPISGDIATYVEVIDDGVYEIQTEKSGTGDFETETPFIVVGLKSIKKFDINAPSGKNAIIIELNILDESGVKVGSANFRCGEVEDIKNLLISGNASQKFKFYSYVSPGTDFFKENDLTKAKKISIRGNWEDIQGYDGTYSGLTVNQSDEESDLNNEFEDGLADEPTGTSFDEKLAQEEAEAANGGPIGEIVIGVKDRIYFYETSNLNSKTSSYFVKGQKAEFFDIEDDNPEDDFLYVYFVYRGKEKTGYVLRSDVKFE
jgi:hypothetical protein